MANKVINFKDSRRRWRRGRKKGTLLIPMFILVGLFAALISVMSLLKIQEIVIVGNTYYSDTQILAICDINENTSLLKSRLIQQVDISEYPYLDKIDISYNDVSGVYIEVTEKNIVGYLSYGDTGYISVDREGYAIDYVTDLPDDNVLIRGIIIESFVLGEQVSIEDDVIQAFIMFKQARQQYELPISSINFIDGKLVEVEFMIGDLLVEFGSMDHFNEKMQKIADTIELIMDSGKRIYDVEHNTLK